MSKRSFYCFFGITYVYALSKQEAKQLYAEEQGYESLAEFEEEFEDSAELEIVDDSTEIAVSEVGDGYNGVPLHVLVTDENKSFIVHDISL